MPRIVFFVLGLAGLSNAAFWNKAEPPKGEVLQINDEVPNFYTQAASSPVIRRQRKFPDDEVQQGRLFDRMNRAREAINDAVSEDEYQDFEQEGEDDPRGIAMGEMDAMQGDRGEPLAVGLNAGIRNGMDGPMRIGRDRIGGMGVGGMDGPLRIDGQIIGGMDNAAGNGRYDARVGRDRFGQPGKGVNRPGMREVNLDVNEGVAGDECNKAAGESCGALGGQADQKGAASLYGGRQMVVAAAAGAGIFSGLCWCCVGRRTRRRKADPELPLHQSYDPRKMRGLNRFGARKTT